MDKKFLKEQMVRLEANFTTERFKITKPMFDLWYEMFHDLEEEGVRVSINEYIKTNDYPPTVASIMKIYNARAQEREELRRYIKGKYIQICRWYEEKPNDDTLAEITKMTTNVPKEDRKKFVEDMAYDAIRFYNDGLAMGATNITVNKFLESYKPCMKKDR
jgi:hypothetical protein